MRWIFLGLVSVAFCINGRAHGQDQPPKLVLMPHLVIGAKEEALAKLKKERFNASLDAIKAYSAKIEAGKATYGDLEFIALARFLTDAALDLGDPALTMKIIDDYVGMAKTALSDAQVQYEAGRIEPYKYHQARYHYLDAQILQARLKKQLDKK
jgi:hypothetical protein